MRRGLVGLLCALGLALPLQANTLYLVRHAEKTAGQDPTLTACGKARAQALAGRFAGIDLLAVFTSDTRRTRDTATPTATMQGLPLSLYDPSDLAALAEGLSALDGDVLVVGHSNTTPELAALLVGQQTLPIGHDEYDWLYRIDDGQLSRQRQGFRCQGDTR